MRTWAWNDRERFLYATAFVGVGAASLSSLNWHGWGQLRSTPWLMVACGVGIAAQRWVSRKPLVIAAVVLFAVGWALAVVDDSWTDPVQGLGVGLICGVWCEGFMRKRSASMLGKYSGGARPDESNGTA